MEAQARSSDCCARLCVAAVGLSGNGSQGKGYTRKAAGAEAGHCKGLRAGDLGSGTGLLTAREARGGGGGGGRNE